MNDLLRISLDSNGAFTATANLWLLLGAFAIAAIATFTLRKVAGICRQQFEINEIELGIGGGRVKITPNHEDLQIAYKLWVELKTRKLGIAFDEQHDVIIEVYTRLLPLRILEPPGRQRLAD